MRIAEWLLLLGAVAAVVVGVLFNGPICPQPFASEVAIGCQNFRFPLEIAAGVLVAAVLVAIFVVRRRSRVSRR